MTEQDHQDESTEYPLVIDIEHIELSTYHYEYQATKNEVAALVHEVEQRVRANDGFVTMTYSRDGKRVSRVHPVRRIGAVTFSHEAGDSDS